MNLIAPENYNLTSEMDKYAQDKDKIALVYESNEGYEETWTYDSLTKKANQLANGFVKQGLVKGDRILIMMPRSMETYAVYMASLKAGLIIIPSSEMLRPKDLTYRLNHAEVKAVFVHHTLTKNIDQTSPSHLQIKMTTENVGGDWHSTQGWYLSEDTSFQTVNTKRDDTAIISYTSGTTGNPKGVVHTHGWGYAHLRTASKSWLNIDEGDRVWATAGPGWQKWVWSPFISTLGSGATGFLYDGRFGPEKYLELLEKHQINVLCCTPTEYRLMAKVDDLDQYHLPGLKSAVSAGEPLNREVIDTFRKYFNIEVRDGYGQTESTLLVCTTIDIEPRPGSMGKPTPGNHVEIIREDGDAADVDEVGDVAVHVDTPALFKTYYKEHERMQKALRGRYFITGDKARKDKDGYFWFEGRGDDIIISSGYTIGPFEVEDALVKHEKVKECAVVSSPDEKRGNIVKAFVILRNHEDVDEPGIIKELQDFVKAATAPYKYPRAIEFVNELPKTTSGKIRRVELREKELQEHGV